MRSVLTAIPRPHLEAMWGALFFWAKMAATQDDAGDAQTFLVLVCELAVIPRWLAHMEYLVAVINDS